MKIWLRIGAVVVGLVVLLGTLAVWIAQSNWLRERVRQEIVSQTERATGGKVELGAFRFDWRTLTAEVDRFVIHGTEPAGEAPLLTVDRIHVGLTLVSLVARDVRIASVEAIRPRANLIVSADGRTNIPEPKLKSPGKSVPETILDLKIGTFDLRNGEFVVGARSTPWEARGEDLATQLAYDPARTSYSGTISVGTLHIAHPQTGRHDIRISAAAAMEKDRILITTATLKTAGSEVELRNTVLNHFAAPVWTGQYQAKVSIGEFTKMARGAVTASGSGRFVSLTDYQTTGSLTGTGVGFDVFRNARVAAEFDAGPERVSLRRARAQLLGGEVTGAGELVNWDKFKVSGRLEHFDLAQVAALRTKQKLPYDGVVSGPFTAQGTFRQQRGSTELTVTPAKTGAPVNGELSVKFDTAAKRIDLGHSWIDLPHSHVEAAGTLGERLEVKVDSHDSSDLIPFLDENTKPDFGWGEVTFQGTVTGPLEHPAVAGSASGQSVRYQKYTIESVAGDFTVTEDKLTVSKGEAVYQGMAGRGSGTIGLAHWQISEKSAVTASVGLSGADAAKILAIAGQNEVPITGTLTGTAQITGQLGNPKIMADASLSKGLIYGQPYDSVAGQMQLLSETAQTFTGLFVSGPKRVNITGRFDRAGTDFPAGSLEFNVTSNTMPLNEINLVRERQPDIHGFGKFHADGALKISRNAQKKIQVDIVSLNVDASANSLELGGRNLGDARLIATTKGTVLSARFDSNAAKASIHGEGTVSLAGDYAVDGKVKFTNAGLNALAMLAMRSDDSRSINFDGTAEGEVSVSGPLRKLEDITARLDIPSIEVHPLPGSDFAHSLPKFAITNSGPIRATLAKGILQIENARLKALETDVSLTGSAALGQNSQLNLRLQGNMNLVLAQSLSPDVRSSGALTLDGTIRGTMNNPDVSGIAVMRNGDFHYSDFSNGLTNANGEIIFNGTRATIQALSAESGGGRVDATGFAAYSGGLLTFRVETKARGVRVRYPAGVSSISDADLTMAGSSQRSDIAGAITVHRVAINPKSDAASILAASTQPLQTASAKNGFAANMNLDVQISTAPDVALQTSVTESLQADASLRLRGTLTNPALLGRINVTQGEIVFFGNKYTINQGAISFFNPAKIEPILNIDLETKARGVDVILTLAGPISKLNVSYRSDPPLQFSDIVALLATGRAPSDPTLAVRQSGQSQSFSQLGANTLIGQAIANPVAGRLQRFFGVSRLKIDPQLTGITGSPEARLTIEQQVTADILFTYITDVSSTSTQLIRVEFAFNKNWSAILVREENGYVGIDFVYKKRFK